jgi:hypothetical protein
MFAGGNPFVEESQATYVGVPRIRITEINDTNVVLAVEVVVDGLVVLTFNRACLRVGDTLNLSNLSMSVDVQIKE